MRECYGGHGGRHEAMHLPLSCTVMADEMTSNVNDTRVHVDRKCVCHPFHRYRSNRISNSRLTNSGLCFDRHFDKGLGAGCAMVSPLREGHDIHEVLHKTDTPVSVNNNATKNLS